MVLRLDRALRFCGGSGLRPRSLVRAFRAILRVRLGLPLAVPRLLLRRLRLLLTPSPPAAGAAARLLRRGQVLGERVRDLLQRPEVLAGCVDELVGTRGVALGRSE